MSSRKNGQVDTGGTMDDFVELLRPIVQGIHSTFGSRCEVVLHDYRDPEHSIVAVAGDITHRNIGGSVTQMGLAVIAEGEDATDQINYITRTQDGRVLKSSTIVLRNHAGNVFGALCINFDVTDFRMLVGALGEMAGATDAPVTPVAFSDDFGQVIRAVIDEEEVALGRSIDRMNKQDRLTIFRALENRGVFTLQRAVPQVAEYLGISRATAYNYLEEIRAVTAES
ncbi:MAG: helix-turn-helix transcriptional regulator [Thermomicrobiales bacterium]